jgi:hypothetical protein
MAITGAKLKRRHVIPLETALRRTKSARTLMTTAYDCPVNQQNKFLNNFPPVQIVNVFVPAVGDRDSYDLRQNSSAPFPPEYYLNYLSNPSILEKIGAVSTYTECSTPVDDNFVKTGDVGDKINGNTICPTCLHFQDARTWLPQLSALVDSRLKTLIWVC